MRALFSFTLVAVLLPGLAGRATAQDEPKKLIEKGITALGGAKNLAKLQAVRTKSTGKLEVMGLSLTYTDEATFQAPGKHRHKVDVEVMGKTISVVSVYNGGKAWLRFDGKTQELKEEQVLKGIREELHARRVLRLTPLLRDKAFTFSPLGEVKVNDRAAIGIKVSCKGQKDIDLFFDKENGLVVKTVHTGLDPGTMKETLLESHYSDYKEVDGVQVPHKTVVRHNDKPLAETEVTEIKVGETIDDSEFEKP
jgi:hypothetical protein